MTEPTQLDAQPDQILQGGRAALREPFAAELERAEDPAATLAGIRARLDAVRSPLRTAERFGIEEIIDPRETRPLLCDWIHDAYAVLPASPGKPSFGTGPEHANTVPCPQYLTTRAGP